MVQSPFPSAVAVPKEVVLDRNSSTDAFASAVPANVGVLSFVLLSVVELPESLFAERSGVDGALGELRSELTVLVA